MNSSSVGGERIYFPSSTIMLLCLLILSELPAPHQSTRCQPGVLRILSLGILQIQCPCWQMMWARHSCPRSLLPLASQEELRGCASLSVVTRLQHLFSRFRIHTSPLGPAERVSWDVKLNDFKYPLYLLVSVLEPSGPAVPGPSTTICVAILIQIHGDAYLISAHDQFLFLFYLSLVLDGLKSGGLPRKITAQTLPDVCKAG